MDTVLTDRQNDRSIECSALVKADFIFFGVWPANNCDSVAAFRVWVPKAVRAKIGLESG